MSFFIVVGSAFSSLTMPNSCSSSTHILYYTIAFDVDDSAYTYKAPHSSVIELRKGWSTCTYIYLYTRVMKKYFESGSSDVIKCTRTHTHTERERCTLLDTSTLTAVRVVLEAGEILWRRSYCSSSLPPLRSSWLRRAYRSASVAYFDPATRAKFP